MIPAIRREVTDVHRWIDESELTDCIAVSQSLPGAFAVNASIYIGKRVKGVAGAFAACFGLVLPAFLSIILILIFLWKVEDNVHVIGAFEGIKAASVALILVTAYQIGRPAFAKRAGIIVGISAFILIVILKVNAIFAIVLGGLAGYIEFIIKNYLARKREREDKR